jgi:hypothetical protein
MDTSTNGISEGNIESKEKSWKKFLFDTMSIKAAKPHMQVQSFLKDGLIEDWDLFEKILNYTFGKHLRCDPSKHPILMSEPVVCILFKVIFLFNLLNFLKHGIFISITKDKYETKTRENVRNSVRKISIAWILFVKEWSFICVEYFLLLFIRK